ncbi:DNA polymerase I [Thalassoglobus polymorphus]|uniref:DNA polymerase I n=1 Tax=Thalassoglobus polymorphus TaxID=2527994 RepID=A0A517QKH2_9PLAN|nr:DNA polymerase I [Thalassoglobus polymorphus]QDT32133.1 DNA polymerase I [Thalassoglobus polymorphus]
MADTLYIVDTFSLIFQVFHAIRQPMTGTRGQPTNAVFGFTGDIQHLLKEKSPTHIICAMESQTPQERVAIYEDYKANRDAMPDELQPQIPLILDVVDAFGIPIVSYPGWEADDVIATVATRAAAEGFDVRVVTSDKDIRQLLAPKIKIYSIRKKQLYDEENLWDDWGVRPDQVVDFQSLVGDSVDNVPGVPLVGPKKAQALLEKFETLEQVLDNADQAPGKKLSENLKTYREQALMSRELVRLNISLPIKLTWEECRVSKPDHQRLLELFTDFGFRRYANEMETALAQTKIEETGSPNREWTKVDDKEKFAEFLSELKDQEKFCVDLETTSIDPLQADIVGWAFCWESGRSFYIPVDGPKGTAVLDPAEVLAAIKPILEDDQRTIVNQNIKYDMLVLRRAGVLIANLGLDSMVGDYLLDAGARTHSLDDISKKYLHRQMIPISNLIGKGKKQLKMFEVDVDDAAEYASEDADVCWQLTEVIEEKLHEEDLWDLYWNLERPLIPVLAEMEWNGIRVDVDELKRQSDHLTLRLSQLMGEIYEAAGSEFNIDSPKQLSKILFEDLNLPIIKRTKTGISTDQEVLEKLASEHPLPAKIIEHRQLSKLKGTYLDAIPNLVNKFTGKIHTSFSQTTAATGRLSSSDPNLQNIPVRTEEGRLIRKAFIPSEPGWKLICLDYSQIELRMLAHFCGDEEMCSAFRDGVDIHTAVAAQVYSVPKEEVDSSQRRVAKAVNFGVIYGQSSFGLAASLGIPKDEAAQFIEDYFTKYSGVQAFMEQTLDDVKETGYATTILGRRREIAGIRGKRWGNLNMPERTAVNTVIQGSAADLIKQAMINVHHRMQREEHPARMLLQIHDELVFEAPEAAVDSLIQLAREEMESALDLSVPIVVDCKTGDNWLDAE